MDKSKEENPDLLNIYNITKDNENYIPEIDADVSSIFSIINNSDFEGTTKDHFISTAEQLVNDINKINTISNNIIKKENKFNNEFINKVKSYLQLIEKNKQLEAKLKVLQAKLAAAIAERKRLEILENKKRGDYIS